MQDVQYRSATPDDAMALTAIYEKTFVETFGHLYNPEDLSAFLSHNSLGLWNERLTNPEIDIYVSEWDGQLLGYGSLTPLHLPVQTSARALELSQLYFDRKLHGTGAAKRVLDWVITRARNRGATELYLSVYTDNHRARRFYLGYGFTEIGPYIFRVGNHEDQDILMLLLL